MDVLSVLDAAVAYRRRLDLGFGMAPIPLHVGFSLAPIQSRRMHYATHACQRCGEPVLLVVFGGEVVTAFDCEEFRQLLHDELIMHNLPSYVLSEARGDLDNSATTSTVCQIWPVMGQPRAISLAEWDRLLEEKMARHCGLELLEAGQSDESERRADAAPTA